MSLTEMPRLTRNGAERESAGGLVAVIGAGPAGLAAALELARHGRRVLVLEGSNVVGGLARTIERNGFRFDIGGHRWFTKSDALNAFFVDLLGDEIVYVDRTSRIYFDGRYVDYPLRPRSALRSIGPVMAARAVLDYGWAQLHQPPSNREHSMEEAYVAQFGRTLYERFFRSYSEKVWGQPCTELSGDWVAQRSGGLSLLGALRSLLGSTNDQYESLAERFMYPRLGYGRLSERMAEEIVALGNAILFESRVTAVRHEGGRVRSVTAQQPSGTREIEVDSLLSSMPMPALVSQLDPAPPNAVQAAAGRLGFRGLITVNVMLRKPRMTSDTWIYVHDPSVPFGRLHEPKNWSPAMVPSDEYTSVVAEFFCSVGDATWTMTDEALCDLTVHHLAHTLGFIRPDEVLHAFAIRSARAYPTYGLGYRQPLATLKAFADQFSNLQLIGRGGAFRYNNADHAIESGLLAARNLLGGRFDLDAVNAEPTYLERRPHPAQAVRRVAAEEAPP